MSTLRERFYEEFPADNMYTNLFGHFLQRELLALAEEMDRRAVKEIFEPNAMADTIPQAYRSIASLFRSKAAELV